MMVTKISTDAPMLEMVAGCEDDMEKANRVSVIEQGFLIWTIIDGLLLIAILSGNILTILAVRYSRRLRSVISNHFVLSLAISDILVGLTLPYHLAFYMGSDLGSNKYFCLLRFFFVIMACCVSIWNLIAIALDRYIAIVHPLHYSRYMTRRIALTLMASGWLVGLAIASIPLIWNKWENAQECEFDQIFYPWYMVGVITPIFSLVWLCMLFVYLRIWREASNQVKQLRITGQQEGTSDWKSVQMILLIVLSFSLSWAPYFIVACTQIYKIVENSSAVAYMAAFTLAMSNSAMNPLIYAWKNSNFRHAFGNLLRCRSPDTLNPSQSMRSNLHRKSSSAQHQESLSGAFPNYSTPPFMQRKIEPISAMGITFEEDEDKLSTNEQTLTIKTELSNAANNSQSVVIRVESDRRSSIVISTATLPTSSPVTAPKENDLTCKRSSENTHSQNAQIDDHSHSMVKLENGIAKTSGNLIVNKLMENYGYEDDDIDIRKFKENFLNVNSSTFDEMSKLKSRSANSIVITKCPNKSNSHGSIFDNVNAKNRRENEKSQEIVHNLESTANIAKSLNKNLFPSFNFGRKFLSKSFNATSTSPEKYSSSEKICRKSTELSFDA